MPHETTHTVVVGGGQAGIAMSEHLGAAGIAHIVLERDRIAERWRTARWDGLVANGPAWHDRFPGLTFDDIPQDSFAPKDRIADYFEAYAAKIAAPVRCGVEVTRAYRRTDASGFRVKTSAGTIDAQTVVAATGPFQRPVIPRIVPDAVVPFQIHSSAYRNPGQLPAGAVLVVGGGASGSQIADELHGAGRTVNLSVSAHGRPPRRYRGRDFCWWLGVLGKWELAAPAPGTEHVTIAVSGANGGKTIDFRRLASQGITLLGRVQDCRNGVLQVAGDLASNIRTGDADYLAVLDEADAYAVRTGIDLPPDPEARVIAADPDCVTGPVLELDMAQADIAAIVWATGYKRDYGWLEADTFDATGEPVHQRGVSNEPGVYFLGLPWLSRRGSSFIWGVWHDARHIADQIAIQNAYMAHEPGHGATGTPERLPEIERMPENERMPKNERMPV